MRTSIVRLSALIALLLSSLLVSGPSLADHSALFSRALPLGSLEPGALGYTTCDLGRFPGTSGVEPAVHTWYVKVRGGTAPQVVTLRIIAVSYSSHDAGQLRAMLRDPSGSVVGEATVPYPAHTGSPVSAEASLFATLDPGTRYTLTLTGEATGTGGVGQHYRVGATARNVELGWIGPLHYLEGGDALNRWAFHANAGEAVSLRIGIDAVGEAAGIPHQATSVRYAVRSDTLAPGPVPPTTASLSPSSPANVTFTSATDATYILEIRGDRHYYVTKKGGHDPGLYATPCPPPRSVTATVHRLHTYQAEADAVASNADVTGKRGWSFSLFSQSRTVLSPRITVDAGHAPSRFACLGAATPSVACPPPPPSTGTLISPPGTFPLTRTAPTLSVNPLQVLDLSVSDIPVTFTTGYDVSRTVSTLEVPAGGGTQDVTLRVTLRDPRYEAFTALFIAIRGVVAGTSVLSSGASGPTSIEPLPAALGERRWRLHAPALDQQYEFTARLSVPNAGPNVLEHRPATLVNASQSPSPCQMSCAYTTEPLVIDEPLLDGEEPGRGKVTFSVSEGMLPWSGGIAHSYTVSYPGSARAQDRPPSVTLSAPAIAPAGSTLLLQAEASDPDGDPIEYEWHVEGSGFRSESGKDLRYTNFVGGETATFVVTARARGKTATARASVQFVNASGRVTGGGGTDQPRSRGGLVVSSDGAAVRGHVELHVAQRVVRGTEFTAFGISPDGRRAFIVGSDAAGSRFRLVVDDNGDGGTDVLRLSVRPGDPLVNDDLTHGNIRIEQGR